MVCVALFPAGTSTTLGLQLSAHLSSYLMQGQAVAGTPHSRVPLQLEPMLLPMLLKCCKHLQERLQYLFLILPT